MSNPVKPLLSTDDDDQMSHPIDYSRMIKFQWKQKGEKGYLISIYVKYKRVCLSHTWMCVCS